jgi:hypothetical protein
MPGGKDVIVARTDAGIDVVGVGAIDVIVASTDEGMLEDI